MPYPTYTTESLTATQQINELVGQSNLVATGAPGVNDDCTAGYHVGSRWLNAQSGTWYMCSSAVVGNATWVAVSGGGGGDGPTGPTGPAGPGLTSAEGVSTLSPIGEDTELDVMSTGPMIVSAAGTYNAGTNDTTGSTPSQTSALYSGNTESGQSGDVLVYSGTSSAGNSGAVQIASGAADGVRGNITLDAPAVTHGQLTLGPDPVSQGAYGIVAHNLNIMVDNSDNVDVGAWLFSADVGEGASSVGVGIGTGNSDGGNTADTWVYSGNVTSGSGGSGVVYVESGDVVDGASGSIQIVTGHANGDGERGSIVLDAPTISAPSGVVIDTGLNPVSVTISAQTADEGDGSPITLTAGPGGNLSGTGGAITLTSGAGPASVGNSGNITLATAAAFGTRGNIILDAPNVTSPLDSWMNVQGGSGGAWIFSADRTDPEDTTPSGSTGVGSGNATAGSGGAAVYTGNSQSNTGAIGLSTGESTSGNSGGIGLQTGNSDSGNSGTITLATGSADGTRGIIQFDAPSFSAPSGFIVDTHGPAISLTISANSADNGNGADINLQAGPGGASSGDGGTVQILGGTSPNGNTGSIYIASPANVNGPSAGVCMESGDTTGGTGNTGNAALGTSDAGGIAGSVYLYAGVSHGDGQKGGSINLGAGHAATGDAPGGDINLNSGNGHGIGTGGIIELVSGTSSTSGSHHLKLWGDSTGISMYAGSAPTDSGATGGGITISGGFGDGVGAGGQVTIAAGASGGDTPTMAAVAFPSPYGDAPGLSPRFFFPNSIILDTQDTSHYIIVKFIPTSDPLVEGALWNSSGTLKISAGP